MGFTGRKRHDRLNSTLCARRGGEKFGTKIDFFFLEREGRREKGVEMGKRGKKGEKGKRDPG